MERNYYKPGVWNAICDRCGIKFKSDELKKEWTGFQVCIACLEFRHVSDFIKSPKPTSPVPFTRPEPVDASAAPTYISTSVGSQDTTIPTVTQGNGSTL